MHLPHIICLECQAESRMQIKATVRIPVFTKLQLLHVALVRNNTIYM